MVLCFDWDVIIELLMFVCLECQFGWYKELSWFTWHHLIFEFWIVIKWFSKKVLKQWQGINKSTAVTVCPWINPDHPQQLSRCPVHLLWCPSLQSSITKTFSPWKCPFPKKNCCAPLRANFKACKGNTKLQHAIQLTQTLFSETFNKAFKNLPAKLQIHRMGQYQHFCEPNF